MIHKSFFFLWGGDVPKNITRYSAAKYIRLITHELKSIYLSLFSSFQLLSYVGVSIPKHVRLVQLSNPLHTTDGLDLLHVHTCHKSAVASWQEHCARRRQHNLDSFDAKPHARYQLFGHGRQQCGKDKNACAANCAPKSRKNAHQCGSTLCHLLLAHTLAKYSQIHWQRSAREFAWRLCHQSVSNSAHSRLSQFVCKSANLQLYER